MSWDIRRLAMALSVLTVLALGIVAGCMDAPTGNNNKVPGGENPPAIAGCDPIDSHDEGKIYRIPVDGGEAPTLIAGNLDLPWGLTVDETGTLYFTEDGTGNCTGVIKKIAADADSGTETETVISGLDRPVTPVIHNGYLYFAQYKQEVGSVNRVNLSTGVKTVLADGLNGPLGLAVESGEGTDWVYFTEDGSPENNYEDGDVKYVGINSDGSFTPVSVMVGNLKRPIGLKMDRHYVYVVEMDGGRVSRVNKEESQGQFFVQETLMTGLLTPYPPELEDPTPDDPNDGNSILYFADFNIADSAAGKIYKLSGVDAESNLISGSVTPDDCGGVGALSCTLLADSLNWPMAVAIDDNNVYWTEIFSPSIRRVGKNGGPSDVVELANGTLDEFKTSPWLDTDGVYVFFGDLGNAPCCFGRFSD
jgi:hypothetical protein